MDRILVPLDGSRLAEAILPVVEGLAGAHDAAVLLLEALPARPAFGGETPAEADAEAYLRRVAARLAARGVRRAAWRLWYDAPDRAIEEAARHHAADVVAMATHGRTGLGRMVFGSVAAAVVRRAPVPVLLVRGELAGEPGAIRRVLVPLDGSPRSEAVLPAVARLAGPLDLAVELLHGVDPSAPPPIAELGETGPGRRPPDPEEYLARLAQGLEARGLRVSHALRLGPPAEEIEAHARATGAGLVAMSTHGRTGLGRWLLGSVAERVVRLAAVPVLLWRASEGTPPAAVAAGAVPQGAAGRPEDAG